MLRFGAVLVIDGERIKAVGPAIAVAVPAGGSLTNETDVEEVLRMAGNAGLLLLPRVVLGGDEFDDRHARAGMSTFRNTSRRAPKSL